LSTRSKVWIGFAVALTAGQALAALTLPRSFALTAFSDIAQCLLLLSGTSAFLLNAVKTKGRVRIFWALMASGLGLWLLYEILWIYIEIYLRKDVPDLFVGDIIVFLHVIPMMAALALQPQRRQDDRSMRFSLLDFALLLVWWLYLYLFTVIPWMYASPNELVYDHNQNILYTLQKIVFLGALLLVWSRSAGFFKKVYAQLFGASCLYTLSSYLANWGIERHVYYTGSIYDLPLALSMAWFTVAAVLGQAEPSKASPEKADLTHPVWVPRLGMITVFSLPVFAVWTLLAPTSSPHVQNFRMILTLGTMMLMGGMVFLKQHLLDQKLLRLLRASRQSFEDLKHLQSQLLQSEKLASLGQLLGGAAHELNNPLTAMMGYSDLLGSSSMADEERSLAAKIGQQVRLTKTLVASLLSFAKQSPAERSPVEVSALAQTAVKLCQGEGSTHKTRVHVDLAADLPPVMGDSNQLLQVCLHIANDLLRSLDERGGGTLTVSTRQEGDRVVLEFKDSGAEQVPSEGAPGSLPTNHAYGSGAAIGLGACLTIIKEHSGTIVRTGAGLKVAGFRIDLPSQQETPGELLMAARQS